MSKIEGSVQMRQAWVKPYSLGTLRQYTKIEDKSSIDWLQKKAILPNRHLLVFTSLGWTIIHGLPWWLQLLLAHPLRFASGAEEKELRGVMQPKGGQSETYPAKLHMRVSLTSCHPILPAGSHFLSSQARGNVPFRSAPSHLFMHPWFGTCCTATTTLSKNRSFKTFLFINNHVAKSIFAQKSS